MSTKILSELFLFNIVSCECATLQLRMVLEGIEMSTLVVNETNYKKIYPDKNIEHEWRATSDKRPGIFERIKSFNPNFYPKPMVESVGLDGRRELKEFVGDFLKEEQFLEYYNKLSDYLHAENSFTGHRDTVAIRIFLSDLINKIVNLLNNHKVGFDGMSNLYILHMKTNLSDDVQMYEFEAVKGP